MNTTTILAKLAAVTAAVVAPVMLFLGAGSATAMGHPGGGPDDPENFSSSVAVRSGILGSVPPVSHPDFDWRPVAPAARPGSPRTAAGVASTPKNRLLPDILGCTECRPSVRPTEVRSWDDHGPSEPDDPEASVGPGR